MDLQSLFYVIAIVVMLLWLVILVMLAMVLWTLYDGIKNAPKRIEETVTNLIENNKSGLMGMVGVTVGSFLLSQVKSWFKR